MLQGLRVAHKCEVTEERKQFLSVLLLRWCKADLFIDFCWLLSGFLLCHVVSKSASCFRLTVLRWNQSKKHLAKQYIHGEPVQLSLLIFSYAGYVYELLVPRPNGLRENHHMLQHEPNGHIPKIFLTNIIEQLTVHFFPKKKPVILLDPINDGFLRPFTLQVINLSNLSFKNYRIIKSDWKQVY
jgi:hypothetical protein